MSREDVRCVALVGLGGALGGAARYGAATLIPWQPPGFPWATLAVNLLGCLLIGIALVVLEEGPGLSTWAHPLLAVGLIGGFTTFSAFSLETVLIVDQSAFGVAAVYVLATVVLGLTAVRLAATATRRIMIGRTAT